MTPAVFVCGLDGVIRLWSVGAERLYGMSASEVVGQKISHIAGSDVAVSDLRSLAALGIGGLWSRRHMALRPGVRPVVLSTFTVADGPGGLGEIVVYSVEIGQAGLGEPSPQEAPFIPSFNDELTILCEQNMVVTYVGAAYLGMFGLLARNLIGRDLRALLHPEDHSLWSKAWISALSEPSAVVPLNVRGRRGSQNWRWLRQGILTKPLDRRVRGVAVTCSAISDQATGASPSSSIAEQTLLAVLEASIEGVWLTDAAGRGVFANARAAEIFGLSVDELLHCTLGDVLGESIVHAARPLSGTRPGPADDEKTTSGALSAYAAGRRGEYELPHRRPDGAMSWIRLALTPRFDHAGQPLGTIVTCAPLSERTAGRSSGIEQLLGSAEASEPAHASEHGGPSAIAGPIFDEARSRALLMKAVPALSRRESEVVIRLILGDRVPTIARILFISQSTVRNHLASAFRKAGVSTQQELIQLVNSTASV